MRMLDLYCGRGGWTKGFLANGFECDGYDLNPEFKQSYPGNFHCADLSMVSLEDFDDRDYLVVVASPPCEEFSRHKMPWTRARNPPPPALDLVRTAYQIADYLDVPLVLENVETAQRWLGRSVMHCGPFHFWGNGVPALLPSDVRRRVKESYSSTERARRAEIPFDIAFWFGTLNW